MTACRIEGIGFWAPRLPGWPEAAAAFRGEAEPLAAPLGRPAPQMLPPGERRRAPASVALALEVASAALAASGRDARELPTVFCSAHGDLEINDHLSATLAREPRHVSPTKFHNSVLNAAAGYWTMATGCREASQALTAYDASFAAGWLEAAAFVAAEGRPVLLVGFDTAACGALASVTRSDGLLAVALVLAPDAESTASIHAAWSLRPGAAERPPLRSAAAQALAGNAMAGALPLFESLACGASGVLDLPLSAMLALSLELRFPD